MSVILNDLIDYVKTRAEQSSPIRTYLIVLLVISTVFFGLFIGFYSQRNAFLRDHGLLMERRYIPTYDAKEVPAILLYHETLTSVETPSVPVVIFIHGINDHKETQLKKAFNYARQGYFTVTIDQRGHGESTTHNSLVYQEVDDVSAILDYMEREFRMVNASNAGLVGCSLGGMVSLIAQSRDARVVATVSMSAPSNMTAMVELLSVDKLFTVTPEIPSIRYAFRVRSPITQLTPENTGNLLILHGAADNFVNISHGEAIYHLLDGANREDIQFVAREGLGHGANQFDELNLNMSVLWMNHYLRGAPVDTANLETVATHNAFTVDEFISFPVSALLVLLGWMCVVVFLLFCRIFMKRDVHELEKAKFDAYSTIYEYEPRSQKEARQIYAFLIGGYFGAFIVGGILSRLFSLSILEAYYVVPPLIGIPVTLGIVYKNDAFRERVGKTFNLRMGLGSKDFGKSLIIMLVPFISFILVGNWMSISLFGWGLNIFNVSFLYFVFLTFLPFFFDIYFHRILIHVQGTRIATWVRKHDYLTLLGLKLSTALFIFFLYPQVYIMGFPISINLVLVLMAIGGLLFFLLYIHIYERISKNLITALLLNSFIISALIAGSIARIL